MELRGVLAAAMRAGFYSFRKKEENLGHTQTPLLPRRYFTLYPGGIGGRGERERHCTSK